MTMRVKHAWEYCLEAFQEEFNKTPRNPAICEMLYAQYIKTWHDFEEHVFMQCKLPRHELMLKRSNFG